MCRQSCLRRYRNINECQWLSRRCMRSSVKPQQPPDGFRVHIWINLQRLTREVLQQSAAPSHAGVHHVYIYHIQTALGPVDMRVLTLRTFSPVCRCLLFQLFVLFTPALQMLLRNVRALHQISWWGGLFHLLLWCISRSKAIGSQWV